MRFDLPEGKQADDMKRLSDYNYKVQYISIIEKWGATTFPAYVYQQPDIKLRESYEGTEYRYLKDIDSLYSLNDNWLYEVSNDDYRAMLQFIGGSEAINTYKNMNAHGFVVSLIQHNRRYNYSYNSNAVAPEDLYKDILDRPIPDWEALKEQYNYTTQYPAIAERIGDTICITVKGYAGTIFRYILNKKHNSIFKRYFDQWSKENCNPWKARDAHIINWSSEISEGTIAEQLGRAKYFGDAFDNVDMLRCVFQMAKSKAYNRDKRESNYLKDIIQLLDMEAMHDALQLGLKSVRFTNCYGKSIEFRDMVGSYISYSRRLVCDPNGKDIYVRHGISKAQFRTLLSLYTGEHSLTSGTVRDIIDGLASVITNGQGTIDFRGFDPVKFNKYVAYCRRLRCSLLSSYIVPRLPDGCDKFKMIEFWMNHNYNLLALQILRDYINMHRRLNPDVPLTLEDYKIKDLEDLQRRHDRLVIAQKEFDDKSFAEKWAMQKPKWEKFCYKDKDFEIVAPESGAEVITEGRVLDHCVGSYVDRIAKGETIVLFMRKRSEPQKPFYTLNISADGTRLIQAHGYKNRWPATDPETLPFLDKWVEKFQFQGWDHIRTVNRDHY
jgi:hypothetical protein